VEATARAHFVTAVYSDCTKSGSCTTAKAELFRPDLAPEDKGAMRFVWTRSGCSNSLVDRSSIPNPYGGFYSNGGNYSTRTSATFHGISCYKYTGGSVQIGDVYGDDTKNDIYGDSYLENDHVYLHKSFDVGQFAWSSSKYGSCDSSAYSPPPKDVFAQACKDAP